MAKLDCMISSIQIFEYPISVPRPHFSVLNKSRIKNEFNITIPY
jgi:dTDP-4-dehydrorhamnose reductase